jgi:hypothetical protein
MNIPDYPEFVPMSIELRENVSTPNMSPDGFPYTPSQNLYLFRAVKRIPGIRDPDRTLIDSGALEGKAVLLQDPCHFPAGVLDSCMRVTIWKGLSDSVHSPNRSIGTVAPAVEEHDNFDYLYLRTELAELSGKKFHKKRNLVNAFINSYKYEERPLTKDLVPQAMSVLDRWREDKGFDGDYVAAKEALELFEVLGMEGAMYNLMETPAVWCHVERSRPGEVFSVHFERHRPLQGIYHFINQAFPQPFPTHPVHQPEQDLATRPPTGEMPSADRLRQEIHAPRPLTHRWPGFKLPSPTYTESSENKMPKRFEGARAARPIEEPPPG